MIRLDNVSKFYYNQGVISVGFSKVSLNFDIGEFVAITGESGSGKSTLLNVISGLDTYEEGEMFIRGEETSHYTEKDFENYRRKYIGNIFQNFNLISSYTVYQNVELPLLLSGMKRREAKARANELIKRVGLSEYKKTKASKLSGGQKQRVAIARALAKDTPVIIADEPTGNLDSESANEIIKLLADISKDKLVIIVTHNFEQVEPYITRKVKMHDGKVVEDVNIDQTDRTIIPDEEYKEPTFSNIRPLSEIIVGVRNAFNIPVKFALLTFVFLFCALAIIYEISFFKYIVYDGGIAGSNTQYANSSENRLIIQKEGNEPFSDADLDKLSQVENVKLLVENDEMIDTSVMLSRSNGSENFNGFAEKISNYDLGEPDIGKLPEKENEILLVASKGNSLLPSKSEEVSALIGSTFKRANCITPIDTVETEYVITGVKYVKDSDDPRSSNDNFLYYFSDEAYIDIRDEIICAYSPSTVSNENETQDLDGTFPNLYVMKSDEVEPGTCEVYTSIEEYVGAAGGTVKFVSKSPYHSESIELIVAGKTQIDSIFSTGYYALNPEDFYKLYSDQSYQVGIFVDDPIQIGKTAKAIEKLGFKVITLKDTYSQSEDSFNQAYTIVNELIVLVIIIILINVTYFVVRTIMKSRKVYYSTIRMLGSNESTCRRLLNIDMIVDANIGFFIVFGAIKLLELIAPNLKPLKMVFKFMNPSIYIAVYVIVILIALLSGIKYSRTLFVNSAMQSAKEEV